MEDFINITTLLDSLSCNYEIDITAIRGFEYYTGICFQLLADREKIGGGGRYNDLIPFMSGKNIPACGFALYIDPIMKLLPLVGSKEDTESRILIKGEESTPEIVRTCFTLAQSLREAKRTVEIDFTEREPSDYRWVISVSKKPSPFALIDCQQKQRRDVASAAEILNILGR